MDHLNDSTAHTKALLRTLSFAKVKFLRYAGLDLYNSLRCKAVPIDRLKKNNDDTSEISLDYQVAFAKVVFGGLPTFGDVLQPSTGLDASCSVILQPDIGTLRILPFAPSSAIVFGYLMDQQTGQLSDLCCRGLLRSFVDRVAEQYSIGFNVGAELEFCLYDGKTNQPVVLSRFADSALLNQKEDFISELYEQLAQLDIEVEMIHEESAPGQLEIVLAYQKDPVSLVDNVVLSRETIRSLAKSCGLKAVFLPKIDLNQAGNGCHVHLSIRDTATGKNLFVKNHSSSCDRVSFMKGSRDDIGEMGQSFMEGILQHLPALLGVTMPSTNSFRRVGQGCWTGHEVSWAFDDKEASIRLVSNNRELAWEHFEFKLCDFQANLYLALACILQCGIDGVERQLLLRPSRLNTNNKDALPTSLTESLNILEKDDLLKQWIPQAMLRAYVAVRRVEEERSSSMSHDDEIREELKKA